MLLKEFIKQLQAIEQESAGTHHNGGMVDVEFMVSDPTDQIDIDVELDRVEPLRSMGCGCWVGAEVWLNVTRRATPNVQNSAMEVQRLRDIIMRYGSIDAYEAMMHQA